MNNRSVTIAWLITTKIYHWFAYVRTSRNSSERISSAVFPASDSHVKTDFSCPFDISWYLDLEDVVVQMFALQLWIKLESQAFDGLIGIVAVAFLFFVCFHQLLFDYTKSSPFMRVSWIRFSFMCCFILSINAMLYLAAIVFYDGCDAVQMYTIVRCLLSVQHDCDMNFSMKTMRPTRKWALASAPLPPPIVLLHNFADDSSFATILFFLDTILPNDIDFRVIIFPSDSLYTLMRRCADISNIVAIEQLFYSHQRFASRFIHSTLWQRTRDPLVKTNVHYVQEIHLNFGMRPQNML